MTTTMLPTGEFWYLPMELVRFGPGSLEHLDAELDRLGGARAFLLTGHTIATQTELVSMVRKALGDRLAGVFDGCREHTPYNAVMAGLAAARQANADCLMSLGGGSVIDTARAVALAVGEQITSAAELERYRATFTPPDAVTLPPTSGRALPHVAVPTTLSAAEFANAGAVTSLGRGEKDLLIADELTPRSVILDPEVAVLTPVSLWVSTGMRALDHAIETVYSPRSQPVTDVLALSAITRLRDSLITAHRDPDDIAARAHGQMAAWMSYFGEMNLTLGLSHAIGHQLGARHGVAHGVTSCIVLPQAMRYLAAATAEKQALVAGALGVDTAGMAPADAAEAAARAVETLVADLGLPSRLAQVGVQEGDFAGLAAGVMRDLVVAGSPVPIHDPQQVIAVLEMAA